MCLNLVLLLWALSPWILELLVSSVWSVWVWLTGARKYTRPCAWIGGLWSLTGYPKRGHWRGFYQELAVDFITKPRAVSALKSACWPSKFPSELGSYVKGIGVQFSGGLCYPWLSHGVTIGQPKDSVAILKFNSHFQRYLLLGQIRKKISLNIWGN